MSNCSISCRKIATGRHLHVNTNVCIQYVTNIKDCNYVITTNENTHEPNISTQE